MSCMPSNPMGCAEFTSRMTLSAWSIHVLLLPTEVEGITADGELIPSTSVGHNNKTGIDQADKVILEVNSAQPIGLEGMHDIYYGTELPPNRKPLMITQASDRIGVPYLCLLY